MGATESRKFLPQRAQRSQRNSPGDVVAVDEWDEFARFRLRGNSGLLRQHRKFIFSPGGAKSVRDTV